MINLPRNKYSMKADLLKNYSNNEKNYLFEKKIINLFLLDGPPFANGEIHLGHLLNKNIKDTLIKFYFINNFNIISNIGWDTHGLPIEQKNIINNYYFYFCRKFVCKNIKLQKKTFFSCNFLNLIFDYNTMEPYYESYQYLIFQYLNFNKLIYKEKMPIFWCYVCSSSLSYSEILYKKIKSYSFYVKLKYYNFNIIIWTTTIWSLINNHACFFLKKNIYIFFKSKKNILIFSNFLFKNLIKIFNLKGKVISFINGLFFNKKTYTLFLNKIFKYFNKKNIFLENNFIDKKIGTNFVHCSPSNGIEDYELYPKKKKIINFFSKNCFLKFFKLFKKINIFYFSKILFKLLKKRNILLKKKIIFHKYIYCWRHKKPIIYFLSNQLFINLNLQYKNLTIKQIILNNLLNINFFPKFIKKTIFQMIFSRSNWCISRQRYWGIPILYKNLFSYYKNISKTFTSYIFLFLYSKKDIFDVWFDSSIISLFLINKKIIIEGKDQVRGWFQSCIIIQILINFKLDIVNIVSHNFCINKKGEKFSKSSKNFKSIKDILSEISFEIVKLHLLEYNFIKNIIFDLNKINNTSYNYKIIRNFLKFLINNFYNFNFNNIKIILIDNWIINKIIFFEKIINFSFLKYNFYNIIKIIKFFLNFISNFYFFYIKNKLYIFKINSYIRNSVLFVIFKLLFFFKKFLFPLLTYTSSELKNFFLYNDVYYKKDIHLSFLLKLKHKKVIIFFKFFFLLEKIKNEFNYFSNRRIKFNNFFWNWFNNSFFIFKKNNGFFCYLSKNKLNNFFFIKKKNICSSCFINKFHNFEEIRFYV